MRKWIPALIAAGLLASVPAQADEVWISNAGTVVYETEIEGFAVLTVTSATATRTVYVDGLAGNFDDRTGRFTGYWVSAPVGDASKSAENCPVTILTADGEAYNYWGRVIIEFDSPAFPSGFTALTGLCFDPPTEDWTATPQ